MPDENFEEVPTHVPGGEGPLTPAEAARSLTDWRNKRNAEAQRPAEPQELAEEADAAPPQEATGETQEADPVEELPPIERPRSWKAEKEAIWSKLDRETQEYLRDHDSEVSKGVRTAQNDYAEKLKGLTTKEQQVEQARQQYDSALPILLQTLQQTMAGEFSDIRSMSDVEKMAAEDWPRYVRWDAQQKKIAAVQQEVMASQQRQEQETRSKFADFAKEQDKLFLEKVPEFADKDKAAKLQSSAIDTLKAEDFTEEELTKLYNGQDKISLRDARLQKIILDASRWRDAQANAAKVVKKPVPPVQVQRPGTAKAPNADAASDVKALEAKLEKASGMNAFRIAAELQRAQRRLASN